MKITALAVALGATLALAGTALAADAPAASPAASPAAKPAKAAKATPVKGDVKSTDPTAKTVTITVGDKDMTYTVDDTTKITKGGKPAKLEDVVAGDKVSGKSTSKDGKDVLSSITVAKAKAPKGGETKPATTPAPAATEAPKPVTATPADVAAAKPRKRATKATTTKADTTK